RSIASWPPTPCSSRWRPWGTGPERGWHAETSQVVGGTTARRHVSIGSPQRRSRTSGSRKEARHAQRSTPVPALERRALHGLAEVRLQPRRHVVGRSLRPRYARVIG